jgi:uncharacterized damage-inducible protein DinB
MPVAHALVMAREDVERALAGLDVNALWSRPAGAASAGFHALHLAGSLDRLFTYARGEQLDDAQRAALEAEKSPPPMQANELIRHVHETIDRALDQLRATDEATLLEPREVGRAKLPSNVLGLLFHAAEHTQRHVGQVITTEMVVRGGGG